MVDRVTVDGRVARRQRNQDMVLDAVLDLFDEGQPDPTVDEVSTRSAVSTRSIYRYFNHREGLLEAALWHLIRRQAKQDPLVIPAGPLDRRVRAFVEHRLRTWGRIAPLARAVDRLARPLDRDPQRSGVRHLFGASPRVVFEPDFAAMAPERRWIAEVAADMAFEFGALDFLAGTLGSDTAAMSSVLERHLCQQLTAA